MKHYGLAYWSDFARGLALPTDRSAMQDHLAGGCSSCRQMAHFCQKLAGTCRDIATYDVPDHVVRRARAILAERLPERPRRPLRIPIQLIYDSFLVPAPAGLRATWQVGWQALFHAGDCSVDLRVEPELRSSRAAVIGQISNRVVPATGMSGLPVCLKAGKLVVAETRSNRFGEFQMEYEQQSRLQLCIYLEGGTKCIQVPLKRLASDKPSASDRLNLEMVPNKKRPRTEQQ